MNSAQGVSARPAGSLLAAFTAGLLPIFFIPISTDAYVLPRAALVVGVGAAAAALRLWPGSSVRGRLGELALPALAVSAALGLSVLTSVNPVLSLVGAYARYESGPVRLGYLLLFCLPVWTIRTPAARRLVISAFLAGCAIAGGEAIFEAWTGIPPRPDGNLGHANLLAALLAMAIPLALQRTLRTPLWALLLVPLTAGLLVTSSRSGWLGAAAGVATLLPLLARSSRWRLAGGTGAAAIMAIGAAVLLLSPLAGLHGDTGSARLHVWRDSLALIAERPLTGHGPDTQGLVLGRHLTGDWEPGASFDRIHELDLDLLATQGIIGLAALGWFWIAWLRGVLGRCLFAAGDPEELPGLVAAWAAYLAVTLLNFDWAPATGPLWLLAGVAWSVLAAPAAGRALNRRLVGAAAAAIAAGGLAAAVLPVAADLAYARGDSALAVGLDPFQAEYRRAHGEDLAARGELGAAAGELGRAGIFGDSLVSTYIELGDVEAGRGRLAAAASAYRAAGQLDRFDPRPPQRLRDLPAE